MNKRGFSLMEMTMVTIAVAIVAAFAIPAYMKTADNTRISRANTLLRTIRNAEQAYEIMYHTYTTNWANLGTERPDTGDFQYDIPMATANDFRITATRIGGPSTYALAINREGIITQLSGSTVLASLPLTTGTSPSQPGSGGPVVDPGTGGTGGIGGVPSTDPGTGGTGGIGGVPSANDSGTGGVGSTPTTDPGKGGGVGGVGSSVQR